MIRRRVRHRSIRRVRSNTREMYITVSRVRSINQKAGEAYARKAGEIYTQKGGETVHP